MKKLRAFNMVEIMIVVCLLATTVMLCLPIIFNNSKEAKIISGWKRIYAEMESNFEVFSVSDAEVIETICKSNISQKEPEIFKVMSPYLNVDLSKNPKALKSYRYKFKNGAHISGQSVVFTRHFSYQENGNVVGFRWLDCACTDKKPCAAVIFDMNGVSKPNRIGDDVFALYIYRNRIEAFGAEYTNEELKKSCIRHSNGLNCSEYYLRGGKF